MGRTLALTTDQGRVDASFVPFAGLRGWEQDDHSAALAAFNVACVELADREASASMGGLQVNGARLGGSVADWSPACAAAQTARPEQARAFFEAWFGPVMLRRGAADTALFTAYYEPEINAARRAGGAFRYPIYARPDDLIEGEPFHTRSEIDQGALAGRGLELFWLDDPVESFLLHVQGSGRLRLPDGSLARVGYGGKNGRPYTSIGKALVERGAFTVEEASGQKIRDWVADNPEQMWDLFALNESYVFFAEQPGLITADRGPIGSFGAPLPALRALAADPAYYPLGAPIWVEAAGRAEAMASLMVALDTGGAIKGAQRGDVFLGSGDAAGHRAGEFRAEGAMIVLLPKPVITRIFTPLLAAGRRRP